MAGLPLVDRLRLCAPALIAILLTLLFAAPWRMGNVALAPHAVWLMALLLPAVAPASFPPLLAFILGLVSDSIDGTPLGSQALLTLLAALFVAGQARRLQIQLFRVRWIEAAIIVAVMELCLWAITGWAEHTLLPVRLAIVDAIVTSLWYPLFYLIADALGALMPGGGRG